MAFSSASILLFALLLFNVCWADNVTLYLDDPRFVTTSQFSNSDLCGNSGWTNSTGDSVSLTFGGGYLTIALRSCRAFLILLSLELCFRYTHHNQLYR